MDSGNDCTLFRKHRFRRYLDICKVCGMTWNAHGNVPLKSIVDKWRLKSQHKGHSSFIADGIVFKGLGSNWDLLPYEVLVIILEHLESWNLCRLMGTNRSWYLLVSSLDETWTTLFMSFPWAESVDKRVIKSACCPRGAFVKKSTQAKEVFLLMRLVKLECDKGFALCNSPDLLELDQFTKTLAQVRAVREAMRHHQGNVVNVALDVQVELREWQAINTEGRKQPGNMAGALDRYLTQAQSRVAKAPHSRERVEELTRQLQQMPLEREINDNYQVARRLFERKIWVPLRELTLRNDHAQAACTSARAVCAKVHDDIRLLRAGFREQKDAILPPKSSGTSEIACSPPMSSDNRPVAPPTPKQILEERHTDPTVLSEENELRRLEREGKVREGRVAEVLTAALVLAVAIAWLRGGGTYWIIAAILFVAASASKFFVNHMTELMFLRPQRDRRKSALGINKIMAPGAVGVQDRGIALQDKYHLPELSLGPEGEVIEKSKSADKIMGVDISAHDRVAALQDKYLVARAELEETARAARRHLDECEAAASVTKQELDAMKRECTAPASASREILARARRINDEASLESSIPCAKPALGLGEAGGRLFWGFLTLGLTLYEERKQVAAWKRRVSDAVAQDRKKR